MLCNAVRAVSDASACLCCRGLRIARGVSMSSHQEDGQPNGTAAEGAPPAGFIRRLVAIGPRRGSRGAAHKARIQSSAISSDFTITGHITCNGEAQLDGEVNGNVECHDLIVAKNGRVKGDIRAENVVIYGRVNGSIHGSQVALKAGASVEGDIYHRGLAIEMGASFLGKSDLLPDAEAR
jgi:cytoskeletal protein CcmA (bactofilin family)